MVHHRARGAAEAGAQGSDRLQAVSPFGRHNFYGVDIKEVSGGLAYPRPWRCCGAGAFSFRGAHDHCRRQRHARGAVRRPGPDAGRAARRSLPGASSGVGHLHGQDVVAVLSRIGKVAAATTATVLIERFGVRRIVFTGVAGGLAPGVKVGDVVVADSFLQHDLDASPIFPKYEVPLYGLSRFPADPALSAPARGRGPGGLARRHPASRAGDQRRPLRRHHRRKPCAAVGPARGARGRDGGRRVRPGLPRLRHAVRRGAHHFRPRRRRRPRATSRASSRRSPAGIRRPSSRPAWRAAGGYLSQPRFLKYHIGTSALATISASANG